MDSGARCLLESFYFHLMRSRSMMRPIHLFYSYAHEDEALRDELDKHLSALRREGSIVDWHDREINAGDEWRKEIARELQEATIILLLVSSDFLASDFCWTELTEAIERHESGEARVIPVILRPCDWQNTPFAHLQAAPPNGRPVTEWENQDKAFLEVSRAIRRAVGALPDDSQPPDTHHNQPQSAKPSPATVRLHYKGKFFLGDGKVDVLFDDETVGNGSQKRGYDVTVKTTTGEHKITIRGAGTFDKAVGEIYGYPDQVLPISLSAAGRYDVELDLERMMGRWSIISLTHRQD